MVQFSDRVKVTSTSVGNGAITLSSSPVTGYQAVPSSLDGITVGYVIESGSAWEIGEGVYTHGTLQLSRTLRSSSTGSLLSLSSGTHTVFLSPAAQDIKAPTITVTVAGGNFLIDGTANQTISLVPSIRYVFDVTSVGNSHPFRFATQIDGASSSQYTTGITVYQDGSNVQKHVEVQLEQDAPSTLYYYCTNHSGMGGTVNVGNASTTYSNATTSAAGLMSSADKTKLDGVETSADVTDTTNVVAALTAGTNITIASDGTIASIASGGGAATSAQIFNEQEFTASAGQTVFTVTNGITNTDNVVVFLNGARLSGSDVSISGSANTVTLVSNATLDDLVTVTEFSQSFAAAYSSSIFTVGTSSEYNTSTKVLTTNYTVNRVAVFLNGVKLLVGTDCTATNGTTIDLTNAAPVTGDKIEVIEHGDAAAGSGVTTHANKTAIDAVSSPSEGDLAFDEDKNVLYIRAGSNWERVQHGGNVGPRFTTTPASTLALSSGSTSTITAVAVDESGFPVTYDWDGISGTTVYNSSSLPNQLTNVAESNGVFTLTPSTNSAHAGSFTFRTKASDGAQVSTATTAVSLSFSQNINTPNSSPFNAAGTNSLNVTFSGVTHNGGNGFSNTLRQGKYYFEVELTSTNGYQMIGLADDAISSAGNFTSGTFSLYGLGGHFPAGGTTNNHTNVINSGDYYMVAYDTSTREIWMGTNGNWHENPSSASSHLIGSSSTTAFKVMIGSGSGSASTFTMDFITGGSGTFNSSVPTGFSAH